MWAIQQKVPPRNFLLKNIVQEEKLCYRKDIAVSETAAYVKLQPLLNNTTERLFNTLQLNTVKKFEHDTFIQLWDFDGSSGHSSYKQAFCDVEVNDSAVFITYLVPLRLMCGDMILWQNPRCGSTRYCRPIKIEFVKDSTSISIAERSNTENQIKNLQDTALIVNSMHIRVAHTLKWWREKYAILLPNRSPVRNTLYAAQQQNNLIKLMKW